MNRRDVLTGALKIGAFSLTAAPFVVPCRAGAATTISYAGWGGSAADFEKEYWLKPFTTETGIAVEYVTGPDLARVKAQVENNNVLWDVVAGLAGFGDESLWEQIDTKIIDLERFIVKPLRFAVPVDAFSGGIAYDPSRSKRPPNDFSQFWDTKNFPGRRGLRNRATETLEAALLADGVAPNQLYPLDVDRAFKALDRIKPYVKKWFAATAEGVSLIQANEVDYTYTYLNRVKGAKESGVSIDFSFHQCIHQVELYSVVRGSPKKEAAMRLLEFITRPEQQAVMANKRAVAPVIKGVERLIEPAARHSLPDLTDPNSVVLDTEYWRKNFSEIDKRYKEWIIT